MSYGVNSLTQIVQDTSGTSTDNHLVISNKADDYKYPSQTLIYADNSWLNARGYKNDYSSTGSGNGQGDLRYRLVFANYPDRLEWTSGPFNTGGDPYTPLDPNYTAAGGNPQKTDMDPKYARHAAGTNNISFLDGHAAAVSQTDTVDYDITTPGGPTAKVLFSYAERPK